MIDVLSLHGSPDEGDDKRDIAAWNAELLASLTGPLGELSLDAVNRGMYHNLGFAGLSDPISLETYRPAGGENGTPLPPI